MRDVRKAIFPTEAGPIDSEGKLNSHSSTRKSIDVKYSLIRATTRTAAIPIVILAIFLNRGDLVAVSARAAAANSRKTIAVLGAIGM